MLQAVLRRRAGSRERRDSKRGALGICAHDQAVRRRRAGHGPDGSATLGLKPARAIAQPAQRRDGLRGSRARSSEQARGLKLQQGCVRCPSACPSSLVPLIIPWARWQRNLRAEGLAPRPDAQGPLVLHAVLRERAGSREGRDRTRGASGIPPHAQAVRHRRAGHGPDGSATLGLKPARAIGATTLFEAADRSRRRGRERRNCSGAA